MLPPIEERLATIEAVQHEHTGLLEGVLAEAKKTNGRIRTLELAKARLDGMKAGYSWVGPTFAAVAAIVISKFL